MPPPRPLAHLSPWPLPTHAAVFGLTFFVWASVHAGRKSYSIIKPILVSNSWFGTDTAVKVSWADTSFFLFYAVGCGFGKISDSKDPRLVITISLLMAAALLVCFGLGDFFDIHSVVAFCLLWGMQAFAQALVWPGCIAVLGEWFPYKRRAAVMGLWCCANNIGNLLGTSVGEVAMVAAAEKRWGAVMMANALLMLMAPVLVFLHLTPLPPPGMNSKRQGLAEKEREEDEVGDGQIKEEGTDWLYHQLEDNEDGVVAVTSLGETPMVQHDAHSLFPHANDDSSRDNSSPLVLPLEKLSHHRTHLLPPITLTRAFLTPGVLEVSLSYACLKGCAYAFTFWLPTLLSSGGWGLSTKQSNFFAMLFDFGCIAGSISIGALATWTRRPIFVYTLSILASALPTYLMGILPEGGGGELGVTGLFLVLVGFLLSAPQYLLVTSVAQDLGQSHGLKGNARAIATMTGVIDGIGSLGAAIVQVLVGNLASCSREEGEGQGGGGGEGEVETMTTCDLPNVFNMLACGSLVGALALSRLAWREIRDAGRGR
ncbi:glycerol-3-phosphate transporter-like isoform x1 [Nannochloropsis oceanica]